MHLSRLTIPLLLLLAVRPAAAQEPAPVDTARVALPRAEAAPARAPAGDSAAVSVARLGLKPLEPVFPIGFPRAPGEDALWLRPRFSDWVRQWERVAEEKAEAKTRELWRAGLPGGKPARTTPRRPAAPASDSVEYLPRLVERDTAADESLIPGAFGQYADLGMMIQGRGELGGDWTRFEPCDPGTFLGGCNPGLMPQLKPETQFAVQVAGTVSERIHVNVDYDQRREFDAANNINLYYQGLDDEMLQRVEVGDVSIRLPSSRYITKGVPAGNFGFKAAGQVGPIDFQTVWAQQKGDLSTREFRPVAGGEGGLVQDAEVVTDDAEYEEGRFFFVVHPDSLAGTPHVDILRLSPADAPNALRPADGTVQIYRDERVTPSPQTQGLSLFAAEAVSPTGAIRHGGNFRRLQENEDYLLDGRSGLWIVLRQPMRPDEALAISYRTETGQVVGTLNADQAGGKPELRLLRGPAAVHQPGADTWDYEMHQVYRLDTSNGVDVNSVELDISLGGLAAGVTYRDHAGQQIPFLKLFGLDEDSPSEKIDAAQIYQPAREALGGPDNARIGGTYVVFPTLRPFARPPPVPSANLSADQALTVLAGDANGSIYDEPDPVTRESSSRFRLNFTYRVRMDGLVSQFSLGALGIRPESETITVDGRTLVAGQDYTMDYDLGLVTLKDPQAIFGPNPNAQIQARWEQQTLFQIAPTGVFGLNARYRLGEAGELNFTGLYQSEKTLMTRPQLGVEPGSIMLGGMSGKLGFDAGWLDRALGAVPWLHAAGQSHVDLSGEMALSLPNPNTRGDTYVDDFESTEAVPIDMVRQFWRLGSRPEDLTGASDVLPGALSLQTAAPIVWQHDYVTDEGQYGGPVLASQIDRSIRVAGTPQADQQVMRITLGDSTTAPDQRTWRSLTTVLSPTGRDMSRSEYLEFYADGADGQDIALVMDVGTVSEDAYFIGQDGALQGTIDGRPWGLGVLDEEARVGLQEIWSTELDRRGLWDHGVACLLPTTGQSYPIGDARSNCTAGNGRLDTEDLDGNGVLEAADGAYFRYVIRLDDELSQYRVRGTEVTGSNFSLYRIPLRDAVAEVNGASDGTWRYIKHLRVTVAGRPGGPGFDVSMARMRIIGSRWTKRGTEGIQRGLIGDEASLAETPFQVGPASRLTHAGYVPPPGISDQLADPSRQFGAGGVEFNEKSIGLGWDGLLPDDRAEVYYRYPQQPRNFMSYRDLRLWAVARGGEWGRQDGDRLVIKAGSDPRNYYLYQTDLPAAPANVSPGDWSELVIDFRQWFELKAEAEHALIAGVPEGSGPVVLWSEDSTYAVVMEDRALAPNLAAVRELSLGVYNAGGAPSTGELWIDDLRLGGAVTDAGFAGRVDLDIRAGDFVTASLSYADRGGLFQQLNEEASYQSSGDFSLRTTAQLGQFAPTGWGLELPLTVAHSRTGLDPSFLNRTDVLAERLPGLRETGGSSTRIGVSLRKRTPASNPWLGLFVDGLGLRLGVNSSETTNVTSRSEAASVDAGVTYSRKLQAREIDPTPGIVEAVLKGILPGALEETALFERITGSQLRWSPETLSFGTSYSDSESRAFRYDKILRLPSDAAVRPTVSPREGLQNTARIGFRPFQTLSADLSLSSTRDLLAPEKATEQEPAREAIQQARSQLAGMDVGWESGRSLSSQLSFRPELTPWLRPGLTYSGRFSAARSPSALERVAGEAGDSLTLMQRSFDADRQVTRTLRLEPSGLLQELLGSAASPEGGWSARLLHGVVRSLQPVDVTWTDALASRFERELGQPGLAYQLAMGDIESFRVIDGDSAVSAVTRQSFRARAGLRLPMQTSLEVGYEDASSRTFGARGGGTTTSRVWPDVRLGWNVIPIPAMLQDIFPRASASAGIQRRDESSRLDGGGNRASERLSVPVTFSLGLGSLMTASYNGSFTAASNEDATGDADSDAGTHTVSLNGAFFAPGGLRDKLPNPIQTSLRFSHGTQTDCRARNNGVAPDPLAPLECVAYNDNANQTMDLTLDTMFDNMNLGLQLSYSDRQSFVGTQPGSSTFQLGFFGQFNFEAGNFAKLRR